MLVVTPGATTTGGVSQGAQSSAALTVEDAEALASQSFLLAAVSPVITAGTQAVGGTGNWRTTVQGVDTDYQVIRDWDIVVGSFFDESDVSSMRREIVLGSTVADVLFPGGDASVNSSSYAASPLEWLAYSSPRAKPPRGEIRTT